MRKNLIYELKNLAQEILVLKDENDIDSLRRKTQEIYEKLTVLDYLNKNQKSKTETIKEIYSKEVQSVESKIAPQKSASIIEKDSKEEFSKVTSKEIKSDQKVPTDKTDTQSEPVRLEELFVPTFDSIKEDMSQKEEFKDTISLDETKKLFKAKKPQPKQLSLNDKLLGKRIQIGLNDRIAFVNKLFNFSQSEFNIVISSLNSFNNKQEALDYIENDVKSKYNWKGQEELEERFILIIERKFL